MEIQKVAKMTLAQIEAMPLEEIVELDIFDSLIRLKHPEKGIELWEFRFIGSPVVGSDPQTYELFQRTSPYKIFAYHRERIKKKSIIQLT